MGPLQSLSPFTWLSWLCFFSFHLVMFTNLLLPLKPNIKEKAQQQKNMSSTILLHHPLVTKKPSTHDTLTERTIRSLIALIVTTGLSFLWYSHRHQLLPLDEEQRDDLSGRMNGAISVAFLACIMFLIKGIFRPTNRRKGSAHTQFNTFLNIVISVFNLTALTNEICDDGRLGSYCKTFVSSFLPNVYVLVLILAFDLPSVVEFRKYIWKEDKFNVDDHVVVDGKQYQVGDIDWLGTSVKFFCEKDGHKVAAYYSAERIQRANVILCSPGNVDLLEDGRGDDQQFMTNVTSVQSLNGSGWF